MKKNNLFLAVGLSAAITALRILQLLFLNEQGLSPVLFTVFIYAVLAVAALGVLIFVRKAEVRPIGLKPVFFGVFALGAALLLETLTRLLLSEAPLGTGQKVLLLLSLLTGLCLVYAFIAEVFLKKAGRNVAVLCGSLSLTAYFVADMVLIFTENRTSLSQLLNFPSLVMLAAAVFFFKALARELLACPTKESQRSLIRSMLILFVIVPAEIIGQLLYLFGAVCDTPVSPARANPAELLTDAAFLLCAALLWVCLTRQKEE